MSQDWRSPPSARALILSAMSAEMPAATLQSLTRIGQVFGMDAATIRVAVSRLARDGLLCQIERGKYTIGKQGAAIQERIRRWRTAEARVEAWSGDWIIVLVDHLGRTDRPRLRCRERALKLSGFAQASAGFWARPNNLCASTLEIIQETVRLGLEPDAVAFGAAEALPHDAARLKDLWSGAALARTYRAWIDELDASMARLPKMDPESAARESFLLGQAVIRAINLDPLLPAEMVDVSLRRQMLDGMIAYDEVGSRCWANLNLNDRRIMPSNPSRPGLGVRSAR